MVRQRDGNDTDSSSGSDNSSSKGPAGGTDRSVLPSNLPPGWTLRITFHGARHLPPADLRPFSSDPFLTASMKKTGLPKRHLEDPRELSRPSDVYRPNQHRHTQLTSKGIGQLSSALQAPRSGRTRFTPPPIRTGKVLGSSPTALRKASRSSVACMMKIPRSVTASLLRPPPRRCGLTVFVVDRVTSEPR